MEEGGFKHRMRAKQLNDFSGLEYLNGIRPTDLDFFIDFGNEVFILGELKVEGCEFTFGQKLAIERLANLICLAGKHCMAFFATHNSNWTEDLPVKDCIVRSVKFDNLDWREPLSDITVKEAINVYLQNKGFIRYIQENG